MKAQYTVRMDELLIEKAKHIAQKEVRSLNNLFEYYITKGITEFEKKNGKIEKEE